MPIKKPTIEIDAIPTKTPSNSLVSGSVSQPAAQLPTDPRVTLAYTQTEPLRPRVINLKTVPFGAELAFHNNDYMYTQPRRYNPKTITTTEYGDFSLHPISAGGKYPFSMNTNGFNFSGYFKSYPPQTVMNESLLALDRNYLNAKATNFTYCMLYDGQTYAFYNDPTTRDGGGVKPTAFALESAGGPKYPTCDPFSVTIAKNLNAFWTAFGLVRQYVTWAYHTIKNVEDVYKGGRSIGDSVYLVLDLESLYNGFWNAGCCLNQSPLNPPFTQQEEETFKTTLADIIRNIRAILSSTRAVLQLETTKLPEKMVYHWSDTAPYGYEQLVDDWVTYIEDLPEKYRNPKIGCYGIPDVYWSDVDGDRGNTTGGWYAEDVATDHQGKVWNYLNKTSRDIVNEFLVDRYAGILDAVDFITPSVYIFEPIDHSLNCTKSGWDFYKNNSEGRDLHRQYNYDCVYRAVLYNKKYNKSKPILPMITTVYYPNSQVYKDYCYKGEYTESSNDFVEYRRIPVSTLKDRIKDCYEAVASNPNQIAGFLWWNAAPALIVNEYYNNNLFSKQYNDPPYDWLRRRRLYNLDYDKTKDPNNDAHWLTQYVDTYKAAIVTLDKSVINQVNNSVITISNGAIAAV
jgi:hypothetical protein